MKPIVTATLEATFIGNLVSENAEGLRITRAALVVTNGALANNRLSIGFRPVATFARHPWELEVTIPLDRVLCSYEPDAEMKTGWLKATSGVALV